MQPDAHERCDIVIPIWNHPEMTRECIESIKKHTDYPYRLILIDNASDAPTREYLKSVEDDKSAKVVLIRNEENSGFVKAANQGMRFSDAPYVCIMNNDTIATKGWLGEMINILRDNDDIGIINPSSNTSGQFPGSLSADVYAKRLRYLTGKHQELYTGRAFAMIVKRSLMMRIGYLDEIYGMGYFDDTDYCKRAQALGYKAVRAKASYVYHKESQSFSRIKEKDVIFLENEDKFVSKWGRYLRVAYVLPPSRSPMKPEEVSSNVNRIAKMGHQVWIFTAPHYEARLKLIDHESIRFLYYPSLFFSIVVLYKIWKRGKKKLLHVILTNDKGIYKTFAIFKRILKAEIFMDGDLPAIEQKLYEMSRKPVR